MQPEPVAVASHRVDRGDFLELLKNAYSADVAGVQDRINLRFPEYGTDGRWQAGNPVGHMCIGENP